MKIAIVCSELVIQTKTSPPTTKVLTRCSTICMAKSTFSPARAGGGQKPWTKFGCSSKIAKNKNAGLTRCLVQLKSE